MPFHTFARRTVLGLICAVAAMPAAAQDRPVVAVANYPLAYFAERLGNGAVDVFFAVPADVDPSFWRPGISDIAAIQAADVIALNGAGFATWPTKASLPRSRTVDTSAGFADRLIKTETVTHSHGEGGEHSHTATASYTWLDFGLAMAQAQVLADAMTRQMPAQADEIAAQAEALLSDLAALDARAAVIGGAAAGKAVIAAHPRYQYFGAAYDLAISAVEWDAQAGPDEAQWAALEAMIADTGAGLFIWEAEPSAASRDRMARLGMIDVVFPPLANSPADGDFLGQMTASLDQLEAALQQLP
ncbi:MAG: metal ABC transporter substrate-binding protein [Yoonia sp.]|uniref:metal ABC transporter substrate-binding protein n=1 Tax=Yoonia sp. TaxID=2212373 RepID=UPI00273D6B0D|nr:metal ABC transporter substrate-binding protein [Yoonia sp.]MDP5085638.1 metal ABC transporter substrate-binding protein [Yoonia sp.]